MLAWDQNLNCWWALGWLDGRCSHTCRDRSSGGVRSETGPHGTVSCTAEHKTGGQAPQERHTALLRRCLPHRHSFILLRRDRPSAGRVLSQTLITSVSPGWAATSCFCLEMQTSLVFSLEPGDRDKRRHAWGGGEDLNRQPLGLRPVDKLEPCSSHGSPFAFLGLSTWVSSSGKTLEGWMWSLRFRINRSCWVPQAEHLPSQSFSLPQPFSPPPSRWLFFPFYPVSPTSLFPLSGSWKWTKGNE